MPKEMTDDNA